MFGKVIAKLEEQADLKPVYIYTFTIFALKTTFVGRRIRQTKKKPSTSTKTDELKFSFKNGASQNIDVGKFSVQAKTKYINLFKHELKQELLEK
jgi:hypothetical protein